MMNIETENEIENLGGDFTKPEWEWLINNGPHGKDFTWSQTKNEPAGFIGVELLEKFITERIENSVFSKEQVITMVRSALQSNNENIVIRAIQVGAVIGTKEELKTISKLTKHSNTLILKNAKASAFYLKRRLKTFGN